MATFNMYTYQFNPIISLPVGAVFDELFLKEQDKVMSQKNATFEKVISKVIYDLQFYHRRHKLSAKLIFHKNDVIVFSLLNKRKDLHDKESIESTEISEPFTLVLICNDANVQRMAIKQCQEAFPNTDIVAKIIQNATSRLLHKNKLNINIRKEYCKTELWDFVNENPNQIQMIRFEFDYPNLPRVHESISELIQKAGRSISGDKAIVQIESTQNGLNLEENNPELQLLNKVSSESGNPITLRLRGLRQHYKIGETTVTKEIDELDITEENADVIRNILSTINK